VGPRVQSPGEGVDLPQTCSSEGQLPIPPFSLRRAHVVDPAFNIWITRYA
jgi:hypothetical protein